MYFRLFFPEEVINEESFGGFLSIANAIMVKYIDDTPINPVKRRKTVTGGTKRNKKKKKNTQKKNTQKKNTQKKNTQKKNTHKKTKKCKTIKCKKSKKYTQRKHR